MHAHFPTGEFDNLIWFSAFLWHSSKGACQFSHFLQYMWGLKKLACSLNTNLNYVTTMLQLPRFATTFTSKMQQLFGCILTDIYVTIAVLSPGPKPYDEFPSKMCKILRFLANFLSALALLCCHYIFDSYVTCLALSFNNVDVYFYSH